MPRDDDGLIYSNGVAIHPDEIKGQNGILAAGLQLANTREQQQAGRGEEHAGLNLFEVEVRTFESMMDSDPLF